MARTQKASDGWTPPANWMRTSRARGIAWVCGIQGSANLLADPSTSDAAEEFLKRFHWLSQGLVRSFGGRFIKWTGDGFLAWFPIHQARELRKAALSAIAAARHLARFVEVTQLGVAMGAGKVEIRHGIAHEKDALAMHYGEPALLFDLLGLGVVRAFQLSGVPAPFPAICTTDEVVKASGGFGGDAAVFVPRTFTRDEVQRFFKGLKPHSLNVAVSTDRQLASVSPDSQVHSLAVLLEAGPPWARDAHRAYGRFLQYALGGKPPRARA